MRSLSHAAAFALFLALLIAACGTPTPRSDGEAGSGFPHGEDWTWGHGPNARANEEACLVCHDPEPVDGIDYRVPDWPPPCNGCHPYPMPERIEDETTASRSSDASGSEGSG